LDDKGRNMLVHEVAANEVRLPDPVEGVVQKVTRYGQVKALVIHPNDFAMIETLIDAYRAHPPDELEISDRELRVHAATDAPETADEYDYAGLAAALDR